MSNRYLPGLAAVGLLTGLAACGAVGVRPSPPPSSPARASIAPRNGLEVVGAMRRAHPSRELKSLAFTLSTVEYPIPSREGTARALAELPGKFRVSDLPASRRSGYVRNQHRLSVFERGRRVSSQSRVDLAQLLAYDLFAQGIDTTIKWLDVARVRFAVARRDEFDGRDVWVVGALEGDTTSPQFWVDADRWRVLRVIQRDPRAPSQVIDVRFSDFTEVLSIPVPMRIHQYRRGKLEQEHIVSNVAVNPSVPSRAFDLSRWRDVKGGN